MSSIGVTLQRGSLQTQSSMARLCWSKSEQISAYLKQISKRAEAMSEQIVLQLLQELGGIATASEISRLAREKYDTGLEKNIGIN